MEGNSTTPKNCVLTDFLHERSTIFLLLFSLIWFWILSRNVVFLDGDNFYKAFAGALVNMSYHEWRKSYAKIVPIQKNYIHHTKICLHNFSLPSKFCFCIRDKAMFCSIIRYICIGETSSGYAALKSSPSKSIHRLQCGPYYCRPHITNIHMIIREVSLLTLWSGCKWTT